MRIWHVWCGRATQLWTSVSAPPLFSARPSSSLIVQGYGHEGAARSTPGDVYGVGRYRQCEPAGSPTHPCPVLSHHRDLLTQHCCSPTSQDPMPEMATRAAPRAPRGRAPRGQEPSPGQMRTSGAAPAADSASSSKRGKGTNADSDIANLEPRLLALPLVDNLDLFLAGPPKPSETCSEPATLW